MPKIMLAQFIQAQGGGGGGGGALGCQVDHLPGKCKNFSNMKSSSFNKKLKANFQ